MGADKSDVITTPMGMKIIPARCFYQTDGKCGKGSSGMDPQRWKACNPASECVFKSNAGAVLRARTPWTKSQIETGIIGRALFKKR